jgi:hypothetical protein
LADVVISHSKKDPESTQLVAAGLSHAGIGVWFDREIQPDEHWRQHLQEARCVIVLWSKSSISSDFVIDESGRALAAGKLIQVRIDEIAVGELPAGFPEKRHDLIGWRGETADPRWRELLQNVQDMISEVPAARGTIASGSPAEDAWLLIKNSIEAADYERFLERYPADRLAQLAREHLADVRAWDATGKDDLAAISAFLAREPFAGLAAEADRAKNQAPAARRGRRRLAAEVMVSIGAISIVALVAVLDYILHVQRIAVSGDIIDKASWAFPIGGAVLGLQAFTLPEVLLKDQKKRSDANLYLLIVLAILSIPSFISLKVNGYIPYFHFEYFVNQIKFGLDRGLIENFSKVMLSSVLVTTFFMSAVGGVVLAIYFAHSRLIRPFFRRSASSD